MPITGIESVTFGVEDFPGAKRFLEDFGLVVKHHSSSNVIFGLPDGSHVNLLHKDDPSLPPAWFTGSGVREVIWGVDHKDALDDLARNVGVDRSVSDRDGIARFESDDGIPFGLKVWSRAPVVRQPDPVNAPGSVGRFNSLRRWRKRAKPSMINHVVFRVRDFHKAFDFMEKRLDFRLTDIARGNGKFGRADGTNEHHNIFFLAARGDDEPGFQHLAFTVEDIDEMMVGANHMTRCGWDTGRLGRHRISSALFYYLKGPAGGEIEYNCDQDIVDDSYVPREWEPVFGNWHWAYPLPPVLSQKESPWDVRFFDTDD